jgi:hypothetical protein
MLELNEILETKYNMWRTVNFDGLEAGPTFSYKEKILHFLRVFQYTYDKGHVKCVPLS